MIKRAKSELKIGLALAGGGMGGAVYEIGALKALDDALNGIDFSKDVTTYVGVSAGSVVASCLANGITTGELCRSIVFNTKDEPAFLPGKFMQPAIKHFAKSGAKLPRLFYEALSDTITQPMDTSVWKVFARLARALPVGMFANEPIRKYLEDVFAIKNRSNDFRQLKKNLFVVATDLDSGKAVLFGERGWDDVPISQAVQASTALPGLYPPVRIRGRFYVDGVLLKTLHASTVLNTGCNFVLCVNPIVPVDTSNSVELGVMRRGKLIDRGMPTVLSQTFRTLIHSRLEVGLKAYETRYMNADVVLFEPAFDDYKMFFTNIFGFKSRKAICEHAYRVTLENIQNRKHELAQVLAKNHVTIRDEVVDNPGRDMWRDIMPSPHGSLTQATYRLEEALARLEQLVEAPTA